MPTQWLKFEGRMQTTQQIRYIKAAREKLEQLDSIKGLDPDEQEALKKLDINSRSELASAILDPAVEDALGESYAFVAGQVAPEKFVEEEEGERGATPLDDDEDDDSTEERDEEDDEDDEDEDDGNTESNSKE